MLQTQKTSRFEICMITQDFYEALVKKNKDLNILITKFSSIVHLCPGTSYEVTNDYATNASGQFSRQILSDGFSPRNLGLEEIDEHFESMQKNMRKDIGHVIEIVHDTIKSYYAYHHYYDTYSIQATDELTSILRKGKLPVMHIRGRKEVIPMSRKAPTSRRGSRTSVKMRRLRLVHKTTGKEKILDVDIEIRGNYLTRCRYLDDFKVSSDFQYTDGGLSINLKGSEIVYFMDQYDAVYRGEIIKYCNVGEWRKFKIQDFLCDPCSM